jgi:hypothetical protein
MLYHLPSLNTLMNRYLILKKIIPLFVVLIFIFYAFDKKLIACPINFLKIEDLFIGLFTGISIFYFSVFISRILKRLSLTNNNSKTRSFIKESLTSGPYAFSVFFTIISIFIISITEEIIFRSIILFYFCKYFNDLLAILFSSALFSIYHFNNKYLQLYIMGIILSGLVLYTGNLASAITAHILNNMMVLFTHSAILKEKRRNVYE